jgi:hypothetical protein
MEPILAQLPADFWNVPYVASRFPGAPTVADRPGLAAGGNCQLFAYEVLRHFGLTPAAWRSSELWDDTDSTVHVPAFEPLDLLLFNASDNPYGAHVGVWAADDAVLHLCAELGRPAVWSLADFAARERYRVLLGAKRLITPSPPGGDARPQPFSRPGRGAPSGKAR